MRITIFPAVRGRIVGLIGAITFPHLPHIIYCQHFLPENIGDANYLLVLLTTVESLSGFASTAQYTTERLIVIPVCYYPGPIERYAVRTEMVGNAIFYPSIWLQS